MLGNTAKTSIDLLNFTETTASATGSASNGNADSQDFTFGQILAARTKKWPSSAPAIAKGSEVPFLPGSVKVGPEILPTGTSPSRNLQVLALLSDQGTSEADFDVIKSLLSKLVSLAISSEKPTSFEIESDSTGKLFITFDPKSKRLAIRFDQDADAKVLPLLSDFLNNFTSLNIHNFEWINSNGRAATALQGKSKTRGPSVNTYGVDVRVESSGKIPLEFANKTNSQREGNIKTAGVFENEFLNSKGNLRAVTLRETSDARPNKNENISEVSKGLKLSGEQAITAIRTIVTETTQSILKASAGKIRVGMQVESKGNLLVEVENENGQTRNRISVATHDVKEWLREQLAQKGIKVGEILVRNKNTAPSSSEPDLNAIKNHYESRVSKVMRGPKLASLEAVDQNFVMSANSKNSKVPTRIRALAEKVRGMSELNEQKKSILQELESLSEAKKGLTHFKGIADEKESRSLRAFDFKLNNADRPPGRPIMGLNSSTAGNPNFDITGGKLVSAMKLESSNLTEMIQKITQMAQHQLNTSNHKLEVQMEVKDMGKVLVDALRQADKINLQIQVDSNEIRRLLESQLRPLVEHMAKEGIDIGKLDVSVRDNRSENQTQNDQTQNDYARHGSHFDDNLKHFGENRKAPYSKDMVHDRLQRHEFGSQTVEIWA